MAFRGSNPFNPSARVFSAVTQSVATATDVVLAYDSERWDTGGFHAAGAPSRFTAIEPGVYLVTANVEWPSASTGVRQLMVRKNGVVDAEIARVQYASAGSVTTRQVVTCLVQMAVGDYVEIVARHTATGTLVIPASAAPHEWECEFSIARVSM